MSPHVVRYPYDHGPDRLDDFRMRSTRAEATDVAPGPTCGPAGESEAKQGGIALMSADDAENPFLGMRAERGQEEVLAGPTRGERSLYAVGLEVRTDGIEAPSEEDSSSVEEEFRRALPAA